MSVARMAALMSQTPFVQYIGSAAHEEGLATVPLPAGAQVGDFCVAMYSSARTIGGGSGATWTTRGEVGTSNVSGRQLLAGDFSTPIMLNDVSPVCVMVWRGPIALSTVRTSGSGSAPAFPSVGTIPMTGFTKSARALAIVGAATGVNGLAEFQRLPFQNVVGNSLVNLQQQLASMTNLANYTNGATLNVITSLGPGSASAAVYELLY